MVNKEPSRPSWRRHFQRLSAQGLRRTLAYYLLTVGSEKLGIKILSAFEYPKATCPGSCSSGVAFAAIASLGSFTPRDLEQIRGYGGEPLLADFKAAFGRGELCVVARSADSGLSCVCWIAETMNYFLNVGYKSFLVQRCFTLPEYRGQGLYPRTLEFACSWLCDANADDCRIFIECSKFNYASRSGILKAGFVAAGTILLAFRRNWNWPHGHARQLVNTEHAK